MMKPKNFKEIYENIYEKFENVMEIERKKTVKNTIMLVFIIIIAWVLIFIVTFDTAPLMILMFILTIFVTMYAEKKINKKYIKLYKERIITEIVNQCNPKLTYNADLGITSAEYAESGFDRGWDRYHSEDCIYGTMEDEVMLKMAQVHTEEERETTDSDGHTSTTYVTTFLGLYGVIKLKTLTTADFIIRGNSKISKFDKKRIEMDSSEFEKYYDVYVGNNPDNRQKAMEILTPETIEEFIKIRNFFKISLNIRVVKNKIYFRLAVGDIFEPPTFKSSVNFDMLYKYFLIIDLPRMIYESLIDNIILMYGDSTARENRTLANMTNEEREKYEKEKQKQEESTYFSHK